MRPTKFALSLLFFLCFVAFGKAQNQTYSVVTQQAQPIEVPNWNIYWKNGSSWERSGGLGTVSIRDNLKVLATHDGDFPDTPESESSTICFQTAGKFAASNCLDLSECPFFVVEQKAANYTVWGPKHCSTSDPGFISK